MCDQSSLTECEVDDRTVQSLDLNSGAAVRHQHDEKTSATRSKFSKKLLKGQSELKQKGLTEKRVKTGICMPLEKEACAALCFSLICLLYIPPNHLHLLPVYFLLCLPFLLSFHYLTLSSIILLTNLPIPSLVSPLSSSSSARSLRGVRLVLANSSSNSPLLTGAIAYFCLPLNQLGLDKPAHLTAWNWVVEERRGMRGWNSGWKIDGDRGKREDEGDREKEIDVFE